MVSIKTAPAISAARCAAVLAMLIPVASCAHGAAEQHGSPPPLGHVPVITSVDQIALPIDSYEVTVEQTRTLFEASTVVTQQCMRSYGLSYPAPQWGDAFSDTPRDLKRRSVVYGFFDPAAPRNDGYDAVAVGDGSPQPPLSDAVRTVLDGVDRTNRPVTVYGGKAVPDHGCLGRGRAEVGDPPMPADSEELPDGGPKVPATDPRMVGANAEWSRCMKSKGFGYASPGAAYFDRKWRSVPRPGAVPVPLTHTREEIATVTADLDCKLSTNLMGVAVAVETAYDKQYIGSHAAALSAFTRSLDDRLAKAQRIIASGGAAAG
ncbi:hypothetical protein [Actinacidiphila acididurans]|uniref:Secreted protein n=1 Tax=Actinacidiphila acididurans TaxID=2784346 RepID=A0ABS2TM54_9ACTN|nr:hypothetical protein [Actinacidiphila acididurans]MBM9504147.1 hypothetical protein [Actinacidiphila acididurans]